MSTTSVFILALAAALTACSNADHKGKFSGGDGARDLTPRNVDATAANDGADDATDGGKGGTTKKPAATKKKPSSKDEPADDAATLRALTTGVAMRNYASINATMSVLTGVPTTNSAVVAAFTDLQTSMPTDRDPKAFLGSHQVAIFKLAVEYCNAAMTDGNVRSALVPGFNFTSGPNAALDSSGKQTLADTLIDKFWGSGLSNRPPHAATAAQLTALVDELLKGKSTSDAKVTVAVATAACTATLAGSPTLLD